MYRKLATGEFRGLELIMKLTGGGFKVFCLYNVLPI